MNDRRSCWSFICVAAGGGVRLGGEPKQFRRLNGRPLWAWSCEAPRRLWERGLVGEVVLVLPSDMEDHWPVRRTFEDLFSPMPLVTVSGGSERYLSVIAGVRAASGDMVMVHDAARPFLSEDLCLRLMEVAEKRGAAIPVVQCNDSVRSIQAGMICGTLDRSSLRLTQTPQAFERERLMAALLRGEGFKDEAEAWLEAGWDVGWVEGDRKLFKITEEWDWKVAVAMTEGLGFRCGHGYDVHPLVPGRPLVLGGVTIDGAPMGLLGHSDGDVVCHAIADALLGAAGEPDIGTLFPASDAAYRGAYSLELLRQVYLRVVELGFTLEWVDVTITAQVPKLSSWISPIKSKISSVFGGLNLVNVKVKSGENVGAVGRGECMICHSVATLRRYGF
ncbi:MAG: 2-C-methyl-D-erythritol 2,4-cyclodiphosphate synthase [Thermanaerothrix sp.]|nr:2-C-methyl-D-erythritol 2,4-cyclodiphosphate synthase [Thermanaerothrix sp.]